VRQVYKGVAAAIIVCIPLSLNLYFWLHGTLLVTALICAVLGLSIVLIVGTRSDQTDAAADAAWLEAAPDLPPASDRRSMETAQRRLPGPRAAGKQAAEKTPRR
jgi:hypothetical protein